MDDLSKNKSFLQYLSNSVKKFTSWLDSTFTVAKLITSTRKAINTVKELDAVLTDLNKTTQLSDRELERLYLSANDVAKQMGVTTKEILQQAAAWSRLGFSTSETAAEMAEYSSMLAALSPGMDLDSATEGLAAVMNTFKIGLSDTGEVVDGIISKINVVGDTLSVNNSELVDFLTRSSGAMAEANNNLEDTIALGAAMVQVTGDAAEAGQILEAVARQTHGYSDGIEELSGKIASLTKTAATPDGISLFSDAAQAQYKSTRQLLQEISQIYNHLTTQKQTDLLETLAGNQGGQALAALLSSFDAVTASLDSMKTSAGNAEAEMAVAMDSIDFKLNRIRETGTGIAQNLFDREEVKSVLDAIGTLGDGLDWLTDRLGLVGSVGLGAGLFAGIKNVGSPKMFGLNIVLNIPTVC